MTDADIATLVVMWNSSRKSVIEKVKVLQELENDVDNFNKKIDMI